MPNLKKCPDCGRPLPDGVLAGNCPACLLNLGLAQRGNDPLADGSAPESRTFGDYELLEEIGSGGMGVVYRARDTKLKRAVALKLIRAGELASPQEIGRFKREAEAAASLDHPNIVPVYEVGECEGWHYLCLKLIDGPGLDRQLRRYQNDPRAAATLLAKVARAIHHAHQRGLLHRDLKPSNILIDPEGEPHVTDFGLARRVGQDLGVTRSGQMVGTPAYMAPEQAQGRPAALTTVADVFSLGVVFYELLTGDIPFAGETPLETLRQVVVQEPKRPSAIRPQVDRDLETICLHCLEKEPGRRYGSAEALAEDLERWLRHEPILARRSGVWSRSAKWVRRHPAPSALVVVLVAGVVLSTWQAVRATRAGRRAAAAEKAAEADAQRAAQSAADEAAQRKRAEDAALEARMTVAHLDFVQASSLIAEGNDTEALAHLVRSLRANPTNAAAVTRLTTLLTYRSWMFPHHVMKHPSEVGGAVFSPDGKHIVTGSFDCSARWWDARTGQALTVPMFTNLARVRLSPDGKRIATSSYDGSVRVWDAQTVKQVTMLAKATNSVSRIQFSPDGNRIVTASEDGTARVWDATTGQPLTEPLKHSDRVSSAEFSPDGQRVVTASWDHTARIWNAQNGQAVARPLKHNHGVYSAHFSPDGKRVVTASEDQTARVWDAQTGQALTPPMKHSRPVWRAEFSADGKRIVTASEDHTARIWDAQTGNALTGPLAHTAWVCSARFGPEGNASLRLRRTTLHGSGMP